MPRRGSTLKLSGPRVSAMYIGEISRFSRTMVDDVLWRMIWPVYSTSATVSLSVVNQSCVWRQHQRFLGKISNILVVLGCFYLLSQSELCRNVTCFIAAGFTVILTSTNKVSTRYIFILAKYDLAQSFTIINLYIYILSKCQNHYVNSIASQ